MPLGVTANGMARRSGCITSPGNWQRFEYFQEIALNNEMTFTATRIYQLAPGTESIDVVDQLTAKLDHLTSMLYMTTGDAFDSFAAHNDEIKRTYLWGCSMAADECKELLTILHDMSRQEKSQGVEP